MTTVLIISLVIGLVAGIIAFISERECLICRTINGVLVFLIVFMISGIFGSSYVEHKARENGDYFYSRIEIKSLSLQSSTQGAFFLGTGSVNNESYYFFYKELNDGGYELSKVRTCSAVIYEDSEDPYIESIAGIEYKGETYHDIRQHRCMKLHDIHVPEGTIVEKYQVN